MYTGQKEKYVSTVFTFGHRTSLNAGTNTYLPAIGGTTPTPVNVEVATIIPRKGWLKTYFGAVRAARSLQMEIPSA